MGNRAAGADVASPGGAEDQATAAVIGAPVIAARGIPPAIPAEAVMEAAMEATVMETTMVPETAISEPAVPETASLGASDPAGQGCQRKAG